MSKRRNFLAADRMSVIAWPEPVGVPAPRRLVARDDACLRLDMGNEVAGSTLTASILCFWISRLSAR